MLLRGVLQALGCQRLQRTDDAEARVARFDHVVDIAVASGVVGIRELVVVLLLRPWGTVWPKYWKKSAWNAPVLREPRQHWLC